MQKDQREGTLYCDSWKKDIGDAFKAAVANQTGEKMSDSFDFPIPMPTALLAGSERFDFSASHSNHPSFITGLLYAIPLRDTNKVESTHTGTVALRKSEIRDATGLRTMTDEILHRLIREEIFIELENRGVLVEGKTLGGYSIKTSNPNSIVHGAHHILPKSGMHVSNHHRFIVIEEDRKGNQISFRERTIEGIDSQAQALQMLMANLQDEGMVFPRYRPGQLPGNSIRIVPCPPATDDLEISAPIEEIAYDYTAKVYSTTGEPDGWGFYGIPANK